MATTTEMPQKLNTQVLFIINLILFSFPVSHQQSCNNQDQASLLAFSAPISTSSSPPLDWSSSITCCSWEGVECDEDGNVIGLQLRYRGLEGEISPSISDLISLTHLDLSKNSFYGFLPNGLFESLSSLEVLDLSLNSLEGNFSLSMSYNGSFPTKIISVDISNNTFHGGIEANMFYGASQLSSFNFSKNNFSGSIPSSICVNSPLLESLDFSENNFSGSVPPSLMNCTNLVSLSFRINMLEGNLSSSLDFSKLSRLEKLDLSRNLFTGPFPESLYSCKTVVAIRVASSNFSGQISPKILEMSSLSFLSLTNNSFTNIKSTLKILSGCKNLTTLFLAYNFYGERLPSKKNFLGSNGFQNMQFLSIIFCNLTGSFPQWISTMMNLKILHLGQNRITGTIPKWLANLPKLFALELSNNLLSGEIPLELLHLPALITANLSNLNHFYFDLPVFSIFPGRHSWDQFIVYPPQFSIQNNKISGTIPSEIGKLRNLHMLYLNGNNLSGEIPVEISYLKNLERLSLGQNHLTGEIPSSLESLSFLSVFNVSYNDLHGPVPTGGQFETFQASVYEGNPGLCGEVLKIPCKPIQDEYDKDDGCTVFLDGLAAGFASGFAALYLVQDLIFAASSG